MMRPTLRPIVLLAALMGAASAVGAQWPPEPKNLQFFPKEIEARELIGHMRGFTQALGERCQFCHVGEEGQPLSEFDFASDEKKHKRMARVMLEMTREINETLLPKLGEPPEELVKVRCVTCHRGQEKPELIGDVMAGVLAADGPEAAVARYRELRDEYYGRGTFDFGVGPLNELAERIGLAGNLDGAAALLELNLEYHPDGSWTHYLMGAVKQRQGDTAAALASYERALELDPENGRAAQRIEQIRAETAEPGDG